MQEHIRQLFTENIQTMIATGEALSGPIESAALTIVQALIALIVKYCAVAKAPLVH